MNAGFPPLAHTLSAAAADHTWEFTTLRLDPRLRNWLTWLFASALRGMHAWTVEYVVQQDSLR